MGNGGKNASVEVRTQYRKKIEKVTKKMDADLLSYDAENGLWKFQVHHFSRYGLNDDDDNDGDKENDGASGSNGTDQAKEKSKPSREDMITGSPSVLRVQGGLNQRESISSTTSKSLP